MGPTRWGIASTGSISHDFVNALTLLPPDDHQIAAVGARKLESAEKFAEEFNISKHYGSYKELADDQDLDVIYIGVITPAHFELSKLFIEAGKNVLCEKPLTMNSEQAKTIITLAREKNVFFMEGIWSRCFPAYRKLKEALAAKAIGDVKFIQIGFGADFLDRGRIGTKEMGDGATYSLACYPIQLANLVFGEVKPEKVIASSVNTANGVDASVFVTLHYSGGRVAQFTCHAQCWLHNVAEIHGSNGTIQIPFFWSPDSLTIAGEKQEFPLPKPKLPMNLPHSEGFVYQAESVRQCLLRGDKEHPLITLDESLAMMSVLDDILMQIGYH